MKRSILFPGRSMTIPQITSGTPPAANQNQAYSFQFTEAGGIYPFTWSATITPNTGARLSINPVTGLLSGTPGTVENETVTVTVTDAMVPPNTAKAVYTIPVNSAVVITTASLPSGNVGSLYSTSLSATGGTPPYTWAMSPTNLDGLTLNSSTGVLSGTPTSATTVSGTFTATDSLGVPSAPVSLSFTATVSGTQGPQRMFQGSTSSNTVRLTWWPPLDGTEPDSYNIYRTDMPLGPGVKLNAAPITRKFFDAGSATSPSIKYPLYTDSTLSPSTNYTYYCKSVYGGVESAPGAQITITTLDATGCTAPSPPTDPATYIPAYTLPTGTVWTATQNTGLTGTGTLGNVGCGFGWALNHAVSGDLIVLSSGVTYTGVGTAGGGYAVNITTPNLWIISDQEPLYNPSGKLPAYTTSTSLRYQSYTATGSIGAAAQSLTLTSNYTGRSGWYTTVFSSGNPSGIESRQALFQNGSATVVWNVGLQAACSASFISGAGNANHISPWDAGVPIGAGNVTNPTPSMPTIQFNTAGNGQGSGVIVGFPNGAGNANNVRLIGINIQPVASYTASTSGLVACVELSGVSATGVMLDRCVIGRDNTVSTRSFFGRAIATNAPNEVIHQCYLYGCDLGPSGSDTQAVLIQGNGPHCLENNYMESVSEICMSGGSFVPETHVQHDIVIRHNWCHKPTAWQQLTTAGSTFSISRRVKNHLELKTGVRFEYYGNVMQNNALLQASQGQNGRAFTFTPRDQISQPNGTWNITSLTWSAGTGLATALTSFNLPANSFFTTTIANASPAGFEGTYVCQVLPDASGFTYAIPNPGATTATFLIDSPAPPGPPTAITLLKPSQAGGMWQNVTDGNIHDNQIYGVATAFYILSDGDYDPTLHCTRMWIHNNVAWINPAFTDDLTTLTKVRGFEFSGQSPDVRINNNTFIIAPAFHGYMTGPTYGMESYQAAAPTPNLLEDRWTITDNVIDGGTGAGLFGSGLTSPPNNGANGALFVSSAFNTTNLVWNKNLFILDTSSGANAWPGGSPTGPNTFNPVAYGNVGFDNFVSNLTMPKTPGEWNVSTGTFATASTTGGPIGASFDSLLADPFPRTYWQVIAPGSVAGAGTSYSSATFQTNAAKFNIVNPGPYAGIEQDMGNTTFPTIFQNIKSKALANGISPCRCIHYTMSSEQSTVGGTGNAGTYTVWSSGIDNANWWLRTSYPAGSIVTFDTNSGVFATTPSNTITGVAPFAGLNYGQGFWTHYDGVLRQGTATTLGYASNKAFVANSLLDGYQMDNVFCTPRSTGAWQMNTTSVAAGSALGAQLIQQGQASQVAALRAINPDLIILGNSDYFVHSTGNFSTSVTLDPSQNGLLDVVYCQSVIGMSFSIEGQGVTTTAQLMQNLINAEALMSPIGTLVMEQSGRARGVAFTSTNQASWVAADWQGARFGLALTCMRNWHYALNNQEDYLPTRPYFMDETLQQGGKYGWLGQPVDAPQSASRTQGVWYRQFQNGVVFMNPAGNGTQTINLTALGLTGFNAIASNGFGDTSINSGAPVTSITLQGRDGRFLKNF